MCDPLERMIYVAEIVGDVLAAIATTIIISGAAAACVMVLT